MERLKRIITWLRTLFDSANGSLYQKGSTKDFLRLTDVMLTLGGTYLKSTRKWPNIFWRCYRLLAVCHTIIIMLNLVESFRNEDNVVVTLWFLLLLIFFSAGFSREFAVRPHFGSIKHAKDFLNDSQITSNDTQYDFEMRNKLHRNVQATCLGMFTIVLICELSVPFLSQDKFYRLPQTLLSWGPTWASVLQVGYNTTVFPLWVNKVFGPTTLITALLSGFHTEFKIMARGFGSFVDGMQLDVYGKTVNSQRDTDEAFWKLLKQRTRFHIERHILISENLKELQLVIKKLYFVIHYHSLLLISFSIYILLMEGSFVGRLIIVISIVNFSLECYWWCSLAESFHDVNKTMEEYIFDLMVTIPYDRKHHSDYVHLRTILMTWKINIRNGSQFTCGGIFNLSMEAFVQTLNTSYYLLTFLLKVGPQSWAKW